MSISNDPNALWNDFKTKFLSVADKHAPISAMLKVNISHG
jgi:hypothetical protein